MRREFICNVAPEIIFNATKRCVRKCFDDDDNFAGLNITQSWCQAFDNGTALDNLLTQFNCTRRSCDEIVAAGLVANAELAEVVGSSAFVAQWSLGVVSALSFVFLALMA